MAPELAAFLEEATTGRGLKLWWDLRVSPSHVFRFQSPRGYAAQALYIAQGLARYRRERGRPTLTKMIRGNLLGGWLAEAMNARVVHVLRHPCAVVASQLRVDPTAWHDHPALLARYLGDERLVDRFLHPHVDKLSRLVDPTDVHAALWCIENAIPMASCEDDHVVPVFYERLLAHEESEWTRLLMALDLSAAPDRTLSARPSQQVSSDMKRESFDAETVGRWRTRLSVAQIDQIASMLDRFEVTFYRADDPMPIG